MLKYDYLIGSVQSPQEQLIYSYKNAP